MVSTSMSQTSHGAASTAAMARTVRRGHGAATVPQSVAGYGGAHRIHMLVTGIEHMSDSRPVMKAMADD
jgi:PII-like signaling protein